MADPADSVGWRESDSHTFIDDGDIFVPDRAAQIETVCGLVPESENGGLLVDLCCGAGHLSAALLAARSDLRVLALDGSSAMRAAAAARLSAYAERFEIAAFDLEATEWRRFDEPPLMVVSSLAVHHLDGPGKQRLYRDMTAALRPGGALVIADLIAPASPAGNRVAADTWDRVTARQAAAAGRPEAEARFCELGWNFFSDPDPDPVDKPSPLVDQLLWMRQAGLAGVDVYWMLAGHAIFGGFKPGT